MNARSSRSGLGRPVAARRVNFPSATAHGTLRPGSVPDHSAAGSRYPPAVHFPRPRWANSTHAGTLNSGRTPIKFQNPSSTIGAAAAAATAGSNHCGASTSAFGTATTRDPPGSRPRAAAFLPPAGFALAV